MTGKQARSLQTYERVLDAAAVEFAQHGYPNTNLQRVAERTGLTKGALYGHFASKEELAAALVERLDQAVRTLAAGTGDTRTPALAKLRSLTFSLADRLHTDIRTTAALRLVMEEARASEEQPAVLSALRTYTVGLVRQAQHERDMAPELPTEPVADLLLVVLFGAHYTASVMDWQELPARIREMWDILDPALRAHQDLWPGDE
jgi:AcrR family transcriptional regulator